MMMPGHTHEDIDAMFRFVADALRQKGLIRTIQDFEDAARKAFEGQQVHVEHVAAVYDYDSWLRPYLGTMSQITTARYFNIGFCEGESTRPVLWYKPHPGHAHLYPTKKDAANLPMFEMINGERSYITEMAGIEIFGKETPSGIPKVQKFYVERLDADTVFKSIDKMIGMLPFLFGEDAKAWWESWRATLPNSPEEAIQTFPIAFEWPQKCDEWKAATMDGLRSEYEETMTYINTQGGQAFNKEDAANAAMEELHGKPPLSAGDLVVVKPGSDDGMHKLPFWIGEVAKDTPAEVDLIDVVWLSAFKGGYARDDLEGQWLHVCKGSQSARGGLIRYHAYTSKCRIGTKDKKSHGVMEGTVEREEVVLYFAELTKKQSHM